MGTIINAIAIMIGGALGLLFRKGSPERIDQTTLQVLGLFTLVVGVSMGFGGLGSALPVLIYQGGITLLASKLQSLFTPEMIRELTSVGGVIVMGIGINILGLQKIRVGNFIPALLLIILLIYVKALFG